MGLHWYYNNDQCISTTINNRLCELPENEYFRDIIYTLGFKKMKNYSIFHYIYLTIVWFIALYKIYLIERKI